MVWFDPDCTAAATAAEYDLATLRVLVERGAGLDFQHPTKGTILHFAAARHFASEDMLSLLQKLPAESEIFTRVHVDTSVNGLTALHVACSFGNVDMVRYAAVNVRGESACSLLAQRCGSS